MADKVLVRDYVKKCGLESILTKLYAVWDKAADICFNDLPDAFMLKSNNGDGKEPILRFVIRKDCLHLTSSH